MNPVSVPAYTGDQTNVARLGATNLAGTSTGPFPCVDQSLPLYEFNAMLIFLDISNYLPHYFCTYVSSSLVTAQVI